MIGCIAFKEHEKPAFRIDCAQGKRLTPSNRSSGLRNEKDFRSVRSGKLARRTRECSSRITGKQETAPAKFEDDLAPTANHSGGKDLRKLRGCVAFCWPNRKLLLVCYHPNYEGI
jgi:hypothetical protein